MRIYYWLGCGILLAAASLPSRAQQVIHLAEAASSESVSSTPDASSEEFPPDEDTDESVSPPPPVAETPQSAPETSAASSTAVPEGSEKFNLVLLQGLNKVTARVSTLEAPLGASIRFGNLEIIARRCWQSAPEERPETAALLEIREFKPGEGEPKTIFTGWMFASSPALSALEHPVYDITVTACQYKKDLE